MLLLSGGISASRALPLQARQFLRFSNTWRMKSSTSTALSEGRWKTHADSTAVKTEAADALFSAEVRSSRTHLGSRHDRAQTEEPGTNDVTISRSHE